MLWLCHRLSRIISGTRSYFCKKTQNMTARLFLVGLALAFLSAQPLFSQTNTSIRVEDLSIPSQPVRPRPQQDEVCIIAFPETMSLLVQVSDKAQMYEVVLVNLATGESITRNMQGSCFVPMPETSSPFLLSVEQNGCPIITELCFL